MKWEGYNDVDVLLKKKKNHKQQAQAQGCVRRSSPLISASEISIYEQEGYKTYT